MLTEGRMINRNNLKLRKAVRLSAFFLALTIVIASCKKEEGSLGLQVHPEEDQLGLLVTDTATVLAHTIQEDSLRSDEFNSNLLGSYVDDVFGKTTASIYTMIRLSEQNVSMVSTSGTTADTQVDSVILYLDLDGYYGELDAQTFEVYRITQEMELDSNYYSSTVLTNDGVNLVEAGTGTIVPDPLNPGVIDGESVNPVLKIRLDNTLGNDIVAQNGTGNLVGPDEFSSWFNGLFITVNNSSQTAGEGAILFTDLLDDNSRMTMYYRYTFPGEEDTLSLNFNINSNAARYTHTSHDYTGTPVEAQLMDSTLGSEAVYVQAMSGLKSVIEFPYLDSLPDSIVINKAELVLPFEYFDGAPHDPHGQLHLLGIDDDGETFFLPDFFEGATIHGGLVDYGANEYRINLAKHVNNVLTGAVSNNRLYLLSSAAMITANRTVINGTASSNKNKMKLILTYTKL